MQLGIVGLPSSGKSTLFQAITRTHLDSAAMAKTDAHLGVVRVPDARLDRRGVPIVEQLESVERWLDERSRLASAVRLLDHLERTRTRILHGR